MPVYLMRFSYTPETWSRLIQNPEDRRHAARTYIEQMGGALHGFWYGAIAGPGNDAAPQAPTTYPHPAL